MKENEEYHDFGGKIEHPDNYPWYRWCWKCLWFRLHYRGKCLKCGNRKKE